MNGCLRLMMKIWFNFVFWIFYLCVFVSCVVCFGIHVASLCGGRFPCKEGPV